MLRSLHGKRMCLYVASSSSWTLSSHSTKWPDFFLNNGDGDHLALAHVEMWLPHSGRRVQEYPCPSFRPAEVAPREYPGVGYGLRRQTRMQGKVSKGKHPTGKVLFCCITNYCL